MSKILGLDLGCNSIGWAIIENNDNLIGMGCRTIANTNQMRYYSRSQRGFEDGKSIRFNSITAILRGVITFSDEQVLTENLPSRLYELVLINKKKALIIGLTTTMFLLAVIIQTQWQFWINLGVGGLFILFNMDNSKSKYND